ncbi:unnamed protein product [Peniophora sp. CBMAI 1063]|nr:unnamed protein product [Peniophora sp. CBMAI 1063]
MLSALLTPLRARFDLSPRLAPETPLPPQEPTPEDVARDVLEELMRQAIERLKALDEPREKIETLSEVHRIMLEDACTKDVFRESDGFLAVISTLSTLSLPRNAVVVEPEEQVSKETLEGVRLVFVITSEAMDDNDPNASYFERHVGYDSLSEVLQPLIVKDDLRDEILGFLFSLSMHDFSLASIFMSLRDVQYDELDHRILQAEPRLGLIAQPGALKLLLSLLPDIAADPSLHYVVYKLLERLTALSHRNKIVLSNLGLLDMLFRNFMSYKSEGDVSTQERRVMQKLLRRVLDLGANPSEVRAIFRAAVNEDNSLNAQVLEILRAGMKARWPDHFSLEKRAAIKFTENNIRGLPGAGFTLLLWMYIERYPTRKTQNIFTFRSTTRDLFSVKLRADGKLELWSSSQARASVTVKTPLAQNRWTHVTVVHRPHRTADASLLLYLDGTLVEPLNWQYPKSESHAQACSYVLGEDSDDGELSWCLASATMLAKPLPDHYPRLIQYLGPRYNATFQSDDIAKFLTYEAATGLSLFLTAMTSKGTAGKDAGTLVKAVNEGYGIDELSIVFSATPSIADMPSRLGQLNVRFSKEGDVVHAQARCLDLAMWQIGGPAVALRLIQSATTPHELSRTLGILTDGLRSSWQNSEDMERMHGYEILGTILRTKSQLINVTTFETLFELIGMNFRSPELSIVQNTVAYRAIALDFELWASTREEIQRQHLEHFSILLLHSRYKRFNVRQRLGKVPLTRQLLFIWQTKWYPDDALPYVQHALKAVIEAMFTADETIKPLVSYLAANLHDTSALIASPRSAISKIDNINKYEKAERLLEMLVRMLCSSREQHRTFAAALPLTRICLLLLGSHPSPVVAEQILELIAASIDFNSTFIRKYELVGGWTVLRTVLPSAWSLGVQSATLRILLGRFWDARDSSPHPQVICSNIFPTVLASLDKQLPLAVMQSSVTGLIGNSDADHETLCSTLMESMIHLQAASQSFRDLFRSQSVTQAFVTAFKSYYVALKSAELRPGLLSILDKLKHFGLTLALDNAVSGTHKREILDLIQSSETLVDGRESGSIGVDPALVTDRRSLTHRLTSARLSIQLGERTVTKAMARVTEWRRTIVAAEAKRLRKTVIDLREDNRQRARMTDWIVPLTMERGLWEKPDVRRKWQLDETEGPFRVRKRLESVGEEHEISKIDESTSYRTVEMPTAEENLGMRMEVPPWAEAYEVSTTDADEDRELMDAEVDDKLRRVRHELEPGDVIEAVSTVARITGVDSSPGLLILGRTHLYMLDGLVENDDGEVIDAQDAPKKLFFVPGSHLEIHNAALHAQRWAYDMIANAGERTFLFRNVALEVYFRDSCSLLVVFLTPKHRTDMQQRLNAILGINNPTLAAPRTPNPLKSPFVGRVMGSSRAFSMFRADQLSTAQRKWQARELSNFSYLSILNQISGRTPNDVTQYPVFPWVLQDYSSEKLDLSDRSVYRDLTRPMGALTPARQEAARARYEALQSVEEQPFHYGTHFSSSMIVCHFMIRLAPFTNMFKTLQGGDWDLPDRLFSDISRAYTSAASDIRGDVRELIPEFYTLPEFLENTDELDFGVLQGSGERIHHVRLPPWAKDDPLLFITMHRKALESEYVSENLPAWIDLIWGSKQRDPDSLNAFHPLSYEGSINLDEITDELQREATVGIIHNFGQTPRKLFSTPHPQRMMHGMSSLPLGQLHGVEEDHGLLVQSTRPAAKALGRGFAVKALVADLIAERVLSYPAGVLANPNHPDERVEWGPSRTGRASAPELRLVVDGRIQKSHEGVEVSCAAFADAENLATGGPDGLVRLWRLRRAPQHSMSLLHLLRVHTGPVLSVTASRPWSMVVSGGSDGTAVVWGLNRAIYIRSLQHGEGEEVHLVAIHEQTGYIASCSRNKLLLHTINGRPIASLDLTPGPAHTPPPITSFTFLEREYSALGGLLACGTPDGRIILRTWSADGTPEGEKAKWEFVTLRTLKAAKNAGITALKFVGEDLFHGDHTGNTYVWQLPE